MGAAFSEHERVMIKEQLKVQAKECMIKYGIKKTTVDQLVEKAGISKGAFYKFYDSKELLFFEIIEDFHSEFFGLALEILHDYAALALEERLEKTIMGVCYFVMQSDFMKNSENEMSYLLRKLPEDVLKNHYHSTNTHIIEIVNQSAIPLAVSDEFVYTFVHALEVLMTNKNDIGEQHFNELLKIFVKGVCGRLVKKEEL